MRLRSKALTLLVTMIAAFAILPAIGAAADELPPGDYEVEIGEDENAETYRFTVDEDGTPIAPDGDTAVFVFGDDDDDGVFEFELKVDGVTYEVAIRIEDEDPSDTRTDDPSAAPTDDGAGDRTYEVSYELVEDDGKGALVSQVAQCALTGQDAIAASLPNHGSFVSAVARGETAFGFDVGGEPYAGDPASFDLTSEDGVTALCDAVSGLVDEPVDEGTEEPVDEPTEEAVEDRTAEASHGDIVSTVAACAPRGRAAREAGLPNHGFFVSAAARGEVLGELVVGETTLGPYDLATQEGADALCADVRAMLTTQADAALDDGSAGDGEEGTESDGRRAAPGRSGDAPGRSGDAPGRSGDAPGRSGEAPGQLKKTG